MEAFFVAEEKLRREKIQKIKRAAKRAEKLEEKHRKPFEKEKRLIAIYLEYKKRAELASEITATVEQIDEVIQGAIVLDRKLESEGVK